MNPLAKISIALVCCLTIPGAPFCSGQTASQSTNAGQGSPASEVDQTRPHLSHQTGKTPDEKPLDADAILNQSSANVTTLLVAPGLHLPGVGRVWALDEFEGKPELVHLKYSKVSIDNHTASNILKEQAAPFIYRPKKTIELNGATSVIRLHDHSPTIFLRGLAEDEAEAESNDGGGQSELALIRLESKPDRRIAATIAFTQITSKAVRSEEIIDVVTEQLPGTNWSKIKPREPLPAGEYGLMKLPKGQNLFGSVVYDFAIDPAAPEVHDSMKADPDVLR